MREILTIAFDWNGTLVDDAERACAAAGAVLRRRRLPPLGLDALRAGFRLPLRTWFATLGVAPDDTADAVREWNLEIGRRPAALATGARETVGLLKAAGMRLGVISAASGDALRRDLARAALAGFAKQLDFVVGDADPKRRTFTELAGVRPHRFIYVGDTEYDIREAHMAGVRAVGYTGGYRPAAELVAAGADHVIARLSELPGLLEEASPPGVADSGGSR